MATRFLWRAKAKLAIAATAAAGGVAATAIATSDDPALALKLCSTVPVRLYRVTMTAATVAFGTSLPRLTIS